MLFVCESKIEVQISRLHRNIKSVNNEKKLHLYARPDIPSAYLSLPGRKMDIEPGLWASGSR